MADFKENPTKYIGQPWSVLFGQYKLWEKEKPPDISEESVHDRSKSKGWSMKLRKADAPVFGVCPALDDCYLAVCEPCGAVIKPQALLSHMDARHKNSDGGSSLSHLETQKPLVKSNNKKAKLAKNLVKPDPAMSILDKYGLPKVPTAAKVSPKVAGKVTGKIAVKPKSAANANSALAMHLSSTIQPLVSLQDAMPKQNGSKSASIPVIQTDTFGPERLPNGLTKRPSIKRLLDDAMPEAAVEKTPAEGRLSLLPTVLLPALPEALYVTSKFEQEISPLPAQSSAVETPKKMLSKNSKCIPCKDRQYEPDKHCGCWLEEWGKHCTRSLTCKTHALSLRRKVSGRSKPFDQLLQEHRDAKEAALLDKLAAGGKVASKSQLSKHNFIAVGAVSADPAQYSRISTSQKQIPKPVVCTPFGDVDMEDVTSEDCFQAEIDGLSTCHPRPLALQDYGARLSGLSFVPNRKLDFLRIALQCAIDNQQPPKKRFCSFQITGMSPNGSLDSGTQLKSKKIKGSSAKKTKKPASTCDAPLSESHIVKSLPAQPPDPAVNAPVAVTTSNSIYFANTTSNKLGTVVSKNMATDTPPLPSNENRQFARAKVLQELGIVFQRQPQGGLSTASSSVPGTHSSQGQTLVDQITTLQPTSVAFSRTAGSTQTGSQPGSQTVSQRANLAGTHYSLKQTAERSEQTLLVPTELRVSRAAADKAVSSSYSLADIASKSKLVNGGLHLTTNTSSIGALGKQKLTVLDGLPCTLYAAKQITTGVGDSQVAKSPANALASSTVLLKAGELVTRPTTTNGVLYSTQKDKGNIASSAVLGFIPHSHQTSSSLTKVTPHSRLDTLPVATISTHIATQKSAQLQQLALSNGATARAAFNPQLIAMHLKQNKTPNMSLTIPLISSPQQQTLHKSASATASAPSNYT